MFLSPRFLPEIDGPLWKAVATADPFHGEPTWLVTMDHNTPAEIVGDFAVELLAAHAEGPRHYLTDTYPISLDETLVAAGWPTVEDERLPHALWQSPDGYAEVHHLPGCLDPAAELAGSKARWVIDPPGVRALRRRRQPTPIRRYGNDLRDLPAQATVAPIAPVRGSSRALAAHAGSALIRSLRPVAPTAAARPATSGAERATTSR
ncbi:DUF317 domain-containing protein [Kitasatospora hibisci]|uniref:DUF317 domain-containing protein n=1 Tax=Kitasatospora hibisci TaxID=3369522 RepID=UPI003754239F